MWLCPDEITWQAVLDGEESGLLYNAHLEGCARCRAVCEQLGIAVAAAGRLAVTEVLPPGFTEQILVRASLQSARPFPAARVAALLFALLSLSLLLLDPGSFAWWASVGFTRQCALFLDAAIGLLLFGSALEAFWWLVPGISLLALSALILTKLRSSEGGI